MENILIPSEIDIKSILNNGINLSPNNYKSVSIKNKNKVRLRDLLDEKLPYVRGGEPGSGAYVKYSNARFIRNSCITKFDFCIQNKKRLFVNPNKIQSIKLQHEDVLLATDANIGESSIYLADVDSTQDNYFSSGIIKLNVKEDTDKFFLLSLLRDSYFLEQLDAITPKGSTIRHSGDRALDCYLPMPKDESQSWVKKILGKLAKIVSYAETIAINKTEMVDSIFECELGRGTFTYSLPTISTLFTETRVDAGFYSEKVEEIFSLVGNFSNGYSTLEELGYKTRRGPNLAKRDLGRSIQTDQYHPNYYKLIYPSDISDNGYLEKVKYLGASGKVWFLSKDDVLFSGEGNVGKTFVICDNELRFTTNFHGIIITPINKKRNNLLNGIFIGAFLYYLKRKGVMDKLSVGGQGGSFAVQYWNKLIFPNFSDEVKQEIASHYFSEKRYSPLSISIDNIEQLGVYGINNLRNECLGLMHEIIMDLKNDELMEEEHYKSILCKNDKRP